MTEDVLNWIKKEKLMTEGDTVIVGLSGGADSVALLLVLLELRQRIGYTLLAIHVEHGIRGEESRKDAAFVEELCRQKSIPCRICPVNVPDYAATEGIGVEEAARILRYECYQKAAEELKQSGAGRVALPLRIMRTTMLRPSYFRWRGEAVCMECAVCTRNGCWKMTF